jgi:hypothetical protein
MEKGGIYLSLVKKLNINGDGYRRIGLMRGVKDQLGKAFHGFCRKEFSATALDKRVGRGIRFAQVGCLISRF